MHFSDELVPVIETPQGLYETARVVSSVSLAGPGWAVPAGLQLKRHCCMLCHTIWQQHNTPTDDQ